MNANRKVVPLDVLTAWFADEAAKYRAKAKWFRAEQKAGRITPNDAANRIEKCQLESRLLTMVYTPRIKRLGRRLGELIKAA